jgi:DNA gyrase subunit B
MPDLINKGHIYIAQPPLYKVKRGKGQERYIKDDAELEEYLIDSSVENMTLKIAGGEEASGEELKRILQIAKNVKQNLEPMIDRLGNQRVVEQLAACDGFNPQNRTVKTAQETARRLDALSAQHDRGWKGDLLESGAFLFARTVRGVETRIEVSAEYLNGHDGQRLAKVHDVFSGFFAKPALLSQADGKDLAVEGPYDLFKKVIETAKKGLAIQRYKGLGEMNPEQLWETTLDVNARSLLQVKGGDDADDLFTKLMGDVVEPRRQFIQDNALSVANLDV